MMLRQLVTVHDCAFPGNRDVVYGKKTSCIYGFCKSKMGRGNLITSYLPACRSNMTDAGTQSVNVTKCVLYGLFTVAVNGINVGILYKCTHVLYCMYTCTVWYNLWYRKGANAFNLLSRTCVRFRWIQGTYTMYLSHVACKTRQNVLNV